MAAEAKGIADGNIDIHGNAVPLCVVQVTALARFLKTNGCVYVSVFNGLDAGNELHTACSA